MAPFVGVVEIVGGLLGERRSLEGNGPPARVPVITTCRLESLPGVSFQAASTAVKQLVDFGVIHERTGYRRNRLLVAEEALRVLNRPLGETSWRR
jgi:hypothetical protein